MARGEGEFRWTLLPTLATYYVYRLEKETKRQMALRKEIHLRYGMPIDGVEMKIDRNLKEASLIVFGEYDGKKGSNHHDRYVVKAFHEVSLSKLEEYYNQIIQNDLTLLVKSNLCKHATEILLTLPKEKDLYIQKYFEQGLDITSILDDIHADPFLIKSRPFKDADDEKFIDDLNDFPKRKLLNLDELKLRATIKPLVLNSNTKRWERDRDVSWTALVSAGHECELDPTHDTFLRSREKVQYMEPHHLIPMSVQGSYEVSLDCIQNILSLCPNCHRAIHYAIAAERTELIKSAFEKKQNQLKEVGIMIELHQLIKVYKVT